MRNARRRPSRGPPRRRTVIVKSRVSNNTLQSRKGETVISGRMYVAPLTKDGIAISVGPNNEQFAGEKLVTNALTYNQYRPISATLMYQPLVNETNGRAIINAWVTSDPQEAIPADDTMVKRTMTSARGKSWFSTKPMNHKIQLPQTQLNSYPTGGNNGTKYADAYRIIIKPTSADASITNYGDVYLHLTIAVSSPIPPPTATSTAVPMTITKDVWLTQIPTAVHQGLILTKYSTNFAVVDKDKSVTDVFSTEGLTSDVKLTELVPNVLAADVFLYTDQKASAVKPYTNTTKGSSYAYDAKDGWKVQAALYQQADPLMVNNTIPVVTSDNALVWSMMKEMLELITARAIPVTNDIDEEGNNIPLEVDITNQPIKITNELDEDKNRVPLNIDVENQPIAVKNQENEDGSIELFQVAVENIPTVMVENKTSSGKLEPLQVEIPISSPVPVEVTKQPIEVHQTKTTSDWITDILGAIGKVALTPEDRDRLQQLASHP